MTGRDKILEEALAAGRKSNWNGVYLIGTGAGKGKIMIEAAKEINPKNILYLCNTTLLRDKMFIDEIHKWDAKYLLPRMEMYCYQTACKFENKSYDLLLADEFDAALTPKYIKAITNNNFNKKILVSATLDDVKRKQAAKIAPIIYERKAKELIEDGVLNKVDYYFVNYNLTATENYQYLDYNKQFKTLLNEVQTAHTKHKLEMLQIQRKHFMSSLNSSADVTKWIIKNLEPRDEKILVFCGLTEQADKISKNVYHSNSTDQDLLNKFDKGEIKTAVVINKVDRGVNIDSIKHIVHESIGSSKTKLTQRIGRGMRLEVDDTLNVFFLIPYFNHPLHGRKPTIVQQWVTSSTSDMDLTNAKTINYTPK